ncbi:hypothetical protein JCM9279_006259 [Rhodotorula babjevae]
MPLSSFLPGFSAAPPRYAGISEPSLFASLAHATDPDAHKGTADPAEALDTANGGAPAKQFDYIICGGGTAGCVLASRLTEDPNVSVLLVEAGESDQKVLFSRVPAGWANLFKTPADWAFSTVPQAELSNRSLFQPRGKMLGGSSAMNAQIYQHCSREDYDAWEASGATGWGWEDLKPYFAKAEGFTPNSAHKFDESLRGKEGVWKTGYPPVSPVVDAWVKSGPAAGVPHNPDLNIETNPNGITRFQATVDSKGQRSSTSAAYLPPPVYTRPNLSILTSTRCSKILLGLSSSTDAAADQGGAQRCVGVELQQARNGQTFVARAKHDVILSLGAFGTPQLLLCSGIGAKDKLGAVGVESELDLPGVGEGLKDHFLAGIFFRAKSGTSLEFLKSQLRTIPSLLRWLVFGTGALTSNLAEGGAFLRSDTITRDGSISSSAAEAKGVVDFAINASGVTSADLEIIAAPVWYLNHAMTPAPAPSADYFTMASTILKPFSTGTVGIRSASVWDEPLIDPRYLSDERDQKVLLAGLHFLRRLSQTKPLADLITGVDLPAGGMQGFLDATDDELLQHSRETAETIYHPFATARIGERSKGGVVDPALHVYGTTNLRICDASIFPDAVSGHPQAAVVAVAEKFADMLKAERSLARSARRPARSEELSGQE